MERDCPELRRDAPGIGSTAVLVEGSTMRGETAMRIPAMVIVV